MIRLQAFKSYNGELYETKKMALEADLKKLMGQIGNMIEYHSTMSFFYKNSNPNSFDKGEFNYDFNYDDIKEYVNKILDQQKKDYEDFNSENKES